MDQWSLGAGETQDWLVPTTPVLLTKGVALQQRIPEGLLSSVLAAILKMPPNSATARADFSVSSINGTLRSQATIEGAEHICNARASALTRFFVVML